MSSFCLNMIFSLVLLGILSWIAVPSNADSFDTDWFMDPDNSSTTQSTVQPTATTPKPDDGDELKKILQKLIDDGKDRSNKAHEKLKDVKTNPYSKMLVSKLNYLELLVKRAESYIDSVGNPFVKQLIEYNIEDLSLMNSFMDTLMSLYDQNFDLSAPVLTKLIADLEAKVGIDIGWLNTNNHPTESRKISDQMTKLGTDLQKLKDLDFSRNPDAVYSQVQVVIETITAFQKLVYKTQQQYNLNPAFIRDY